MAKQKGIIKLEGTIGDITFYKSQDGHLARGKGGVDGKRIATDPNFQRTRENGSEFGRAGKAGKILRNSMRAILQNSKDSRMVSRLTKKMVEVLQQDLTSTRGQRNIIDGEAEILEGFEFNANAKFSITMYAPFTATINRVAGTLAVNIPAYIPGNMIAAPGGCTHFKLISAAAEIDFENDNFVIDTADTLVLPWDFAATAIIDLPNNVSANSTQPLFLAFGIEFYQEVNGIIVKVSGLTRSRGRPQGTPNYGQRVDCYLLK